MSQQQQSSSSSAVTTSMLDNAAGETTNAFIYPPNNGAFDEAYQSSITMLPHWQMLVDKFQNLGIDKLNHYHTKTQRMLRDDGATYKAYEDSQERTWGLDPTPLLMDEMAWKTIDTGLAQRATLFDLLLKDIYGPQLLIREGVIPPESVFANPGFLRPCFESSAIADNGLLLHAADIVRTANGVCVIGDRTQSPQGVGYALENRTVMTRVFPSLYRDTSVRNLAMFFNTLRHQLNQLSSSNELPNVVVLTPGRRNEAYFEHAYLANYLGYSLVQGRDLTVRQGRVWTKSLNGLTQVDVILRHVDDSLCDPAELKSDSYLGVPGLLEVVRAKRVTIANPIGSGVLESPVFLKYLNAISQFFTGQPASLANVPTYWAYDKKDINYILDNMKQLVIKPAFDRHNNASVLGSDLSDDELDLMRKKIQAKPLSFIAQDYMPASCSPSWKENGFISLPSVLRCFSVANEEGYRVMPGGLTRTESSQQSHLLNRQSSTVSKDVWVITSEPEVQVNLWTDKNAAGLFQQNSLLALPSRVIENMFWLGRYAIRAEYALRLLRTIFIQLNQSQQLSPVGYQTLLMSVTEVTKTFPGFSPSDDKEDEDPEAELISVVLDEKKPGSVMANLMEMLECAEEVKALLSADTQRVINDIRDEVYSLKAALADDFTSAPEEALDPLVTSLLAFSGLVHESMMRSYGWRFLEVGRTLERSYQTLSLMKALLVIEQKEFDEDVVLETLLLTLETLITYRRRYRARADVINGLELTMMDETNPRSLHYLLKLLSEHIDALPSSHTAVVFSPEKRTIVDVLNRIQLADLEKLAKVNEEGKRENIKQFSEAAQGLLSDLSSILSKRYFDHQDDYQQVQAEKWGDEI